VIAAYLAEESALGRAERTVRDYRARLGYFAAYAGGAQPELVSLEAVRGYHESLIARGLSSSSRNSYMSSVRAYLRWAHRRGLLGADLSVRVELPKPERRLPPVPLTAGQAAALIDGAPGAGAAGLRNRAILELLYACGLRHGELLGLDVADVDFGERRLFVRGKGAKDRVLPVHRRALAAVAAYLRARGGRQDAGAPLFTSREGGPGPRMARLTPLFGPASRRLGRRVYPHLLRHTFAVHMLQGGANLRYVQALLGHDSPETTGRYLGLAKDDLKSAYDAAMLNLYRMGDGRRTRSPRPAGRP